MSNSPAPLKQKVRVRITDKRHFHNGETGLVISEPGEFDQYLIALDNCPHHVNQCYATMEQLEKL